MKNIINSIDNLTYSTLNKFSKLKWVAWMIKSEDFPPKLYAWGNIIRNLTFAVIFFWLMIQIGFSKDFKTTIVPSAFVMIYGLFYLLFWKKFLEYLSGYWGEKRVEKVLEKIESTKTIHNVIIPGNTGNIDHLVFLPQGILPIETKAWMGEIDIYKKYWIKRNGKRETRIKPTPLNQAWGCEKNVRDYLNKSGIDGRLVLPGIVVFAIQPDKINWYNEETRILQLKELKPYLKDILDKPSKDRNEISKAYKIINANN